MIIKLTLASDNIARYRTVSQDICKANLAAEEQTFDAFHLDFTLWQVSLCSTEMS